MQSTDLPFDVTGATVPFKIIIIYENLAAGIRAQETAERLSKQLNPDTEMNVDLWKFDLLAHTSMQERAARDAADADMLIVSADANTKLPVHVRSWLERLLPVVERPEARRALVALLAADREHRVTWEAEDVRDYLQHVAAEQGMDFFCKNDPAPSKADDIAHPRDLPANSHLFLDEAFTPDISWRRWGIND